MVLYAYTSIDEFIIRYIKKGGQAYCIDEGVLASGDWILFDAKGKLKSYIIKEVYISDYSSGQSLRRYRKLPEKYAKMIRDKKAKRKKIHEIKY
ncbi:hypothetical protein [uncultured Bacteroides sp.]|uniref:hypothetical protein n=1 Tax=uncultured Bacteroides sp. TaxID=162156 RepID=UPI0025CC1F62|nr:hypothetical protein [uncultured Bacteroides sp.]